jgi:hypothetical protein
LANSNVFSSPGVFTREFDLSFRPLEIPAVGAAVIGPTVRGPAFVPTPISTYSEYIRWFGDTFISGSGASERMYKYLTTHCVQEYLRYPANWNQIDKNIKKLAKLPSNIFIFAVPVIQNVNLETITDFFKYIESINNEYGYYRIRLLPIMLDSPSYLDLSILPTDYKLKCLNTCSCVLFKSETTSILNQVSTHTFLFFIVIKSGFSVNFFIVYNIYLSYFSYFYHYK